MRSIEGKISSKGMPASRLVGFGSSIAARRQNPPHLAYGYRVVQDMTEISIVPVEKEAERGHCSKIRRYIP